MTFTALHRADGAAAGIRGLVEEIDPTSLSRMLGYSKQIMAKHATAATVPWSSYVIDKNPRFADERSPSEGPGTRPS